MDFIFTEGHEGNEEKKKKKNVISYLLSVICSPYSEGGSFTELLFFGAAL
jgi:hypothetical protein